MNYEEKYNEALKDMRVIYPNLKGDAKLAVEHAFPELAESEDERIRKVIVKYFKELHEESWINLEIPDILAWLERQKEEEGYEAIPVESTLEYKLGFKAGKESEKQKEQKPSEDELAKRHLEGYIMGREDTMREMKDFIESHFNTNKAREGEDLTDLYYKEYIMNPQPIPSGWGCDGTHCTNPHGDCINCPKRFTTGGTITTPNTASGTSTLKAEG